MATADIAKEAIFDPRIQQNNARYGVYKSALSLTNAPYNAISATSSQHTYNINAPSQNVFVDRAVEWTATPQLSFQVVVNNAVQAFSANQPIITFGRDVALCAFPLNSLVATMTATINDTSVVVNTTSVLKELLRLTDYKKNRLSRTCPTMLDKYASYNDAYLAVNSPLASYVDATEATEQPNGAWYNVQFCNPSTGAVFTSAGASVYSFNDGTGVFNVDVAQVGNMYIPIRTKTGGNEPAYYLVGIQFTSTEKLVLSPFIFADSAEWETGIFGVNNIQLVFNMGSSDVIQRVLRNATNGGRTITPNTIAYIGNGYAGTSRINVQFLSPSLDLPLPSRSTIPYLEYPRYLSTYTNITANAGAGFELQSQTYVLPMIPDALVIYVKPTAYADATNADWYYPITSISINWDNVAGILSSHTTEQLYQMSVHNGLEMDFNEWRGFAMSARKQATIQTCGGFLVLKPGQDIPLMSGASPGLLGNYVLQFKATCYNYNALVSAGVSLFVMTINSGFFETLAGSSRVVKAVVSEADIISAEPAPEGVMLPRLVGHGFMSKLGSMLSKAKDIYTASKPAISAIKSALPEEGKLGKVKGALGAVGYGQAGAGKKSLSARLM